MEKKQIYRRIFAFGLAFFLVVAALLLLTASKTVSVAVRNALNLCLNTLIPSLYSFMILSSFIMSTEGMNPLLRPFYPLTRYLFKENGDCTAVIFLSMIAGYPVGAKLIAERVKQKKLSLESAEQMMCYCVNAGPAFLISGISAAKFSSLAVGFYILAAHIISNLIIGFFMNLRRKIPEKTHETDTRRERESLSGALINSVNGATKSMAMICSMVIAFSVILSLLDSLGIIRSLVATLQGIFPKEIPLEQIIPGIFEVTQGCLSVKEHQVLSIYLVAGLTAFGGICVHFQIIAMVHGTGIRLKKYFITRIWHVFNSIALCFIMIRWMNPDLEVFAPGEPIQIERYSASPMASCFLIFLCVLLLLSSRKSDKMKKG